MASNGWFAYAGTEIASVHRLTAYLLNGDLAEQMGDCLPIVDGTCGCPADDLGPYVSPEVDNAPWFDSALPDSADFLGVLLTRVDGLDSSPLTRTLTRSASVGGFLGRLNLGPRTVTFHATLYAVSDCGMAYGKRWLTEALKGFPCDSSHKSEACFRDCCPVGAEPDPDGTGGGILHAYNIGVLDAPLFSDVFDDGSCCTHIQDVTWSMAAESPWLFDEPIVAGVLRPDPLTAHCIAFCDDTCDDDVPSLCDVEEAPDTYCEPWCRTNTVCTTILAQPDWRDAATVFTVEAGVTGLTLLLIKAWENVGHFTDLYEDVYTDVYAFESVEDCPDVDPDAWACIEPCHVTQVRGLPPLSTLTVDGRSRTITLRCSDGTETAGDPYVSGKKGLLEWLEPGCAELCVCAYASTDRLNGTAVTVSYVPRTGG